MATLPLVARRRRALDPRILIGIALIVASALGTTALVGALTRTVVIYRAQGAIVAGDRLTSARLEPATVRLGDAAGLYLSGPIPSGGLIATRTIVSGEMVPRSAVGTSAALNTATVVVDLTSSLASEVAAGSTVDLWAAAKVDSTAKQYGAPVVLVTGATVARVVAPGGLITSSTQHSVELQIPRDEVASVLAAQADDARLSAVAVGGTSR